MLTPLTSTLIAHKDTISFHTPAHCGGIVGLLDCNLLQLDSTELSFSDNLLCPVGVIKDSLAMINAAYKTEATTYVTTGATTAIHIAIRTLRKQNFLVLSETHKSVFNALRLNNATAYYADCVENFESYLDLYNIGVVVATSPNYFGETLPLDVISTICKAHNVQLLVDASHGSHFMFCDKLPVSATVYADWVIHSCHKTMSVPTGGALLHYPKSYEVAVQFALNEIHSSSPSYLIMSTMEQSISYLATNGQSLYCSILNKIADCVSSLTNNFNVVPTADGTRLVISSPWIGSAVASGLEKSGIFAEMSGDNRVVFIVNYTNYIYVEKLIDTLNSMDCSTFPMYVDCSPSLCSCSIKKLQFFDEFELIPISQSVGKICFHEVGLYPPGTALLVSGETITKQKADMLANFTNLAFGLVNDSIAVVK